MQTITRTANTTLRRAFAKRARTAVNMLFAASIAAERGHGRLRGRI